MVNSYDTSCAYCQKDLSANNSYDTSLISYGIYLQRSAKLSAKEIETLSDVPREFIDQLPNGLIINNFR